MYTRPKESIHVWPWVYRMWRAKEKAPGLHHLYNRPCKRKGKYTLTFWVIEYMGRSRQFGKGRGTNQKYDPEIVKKGGAQVQNVLITNQKFKSSVYH